MEVVSVTYNGKSFQMEIDQINTDVLSNLFGFPDTNYAIVDTNNIVIRRREKSFLVTENRGPFTIVRTAPTSTRTYIIFYNTFMFFK